MKKIPVTKPYFSEEEKRITLEVLDSGWVAQGPRAAAFEKNVAEHEGVAEGVATTSCTTALHLAMSAQGMGAGMDVIVPAFTFVATENAVLSTGAIPVLVDICKDTFNVNVNKLLEVVEQKYYKKDRVLINKETGNALWGIVPVHEFGLCCDIYKINSIAQEYNFHIIEDAACALGSKIGEVHQGGFGNPSCISFHPRKSITTGEGGMILTDNVELAKGLRELRSHGCTISADERDKGKGFLLPEFEKAGYNYRMTDLQAAIGQAQMKKLDYIIAEKRKKVALYNEMIQSRIPELITPVEPEGFFHTYQSYVCMLDKNRLKGKSIEDCGIYRNYIMQELEDRGIATRQGTHAVHTLGYYRKRFGYMPNMFPDAYECDRLSIALPLYVDLTVEEQEYVIENIGEVLSNGNGF